MGEESEYEVLRDHGTKPGGAVGPAFRRGETRKLRSEDAKPLIDAGVLKGDGDEEVDAKAEKAPLNKAEPAPENKRGPGRPRTNPPADEDA